MTLFTNPITGSFLFFFISGFLFCAIYAPILNARKRREAEAKARAKAEREAEDARKKQEAATMRAKKAAEKQAAEELLKAQKAAQREEARKVREAEAAAAREAKRKFTAAELLADAPKDVKPFEGQKIAFTGRFPRVERAELIQVVEALGGRGHDTTHAGTTLLVICPRSGNGQIDKAAHWKIPTITWEQWYKQAFGKEPGPEFTAAIV